MSQGWVMFVSVFCFVISTLLLLLYMCGAHGGKSAWVAVDAFYQVIATVFYLSAAVLQAYTTYLMKGDVIYKNYQIDIAAVPWPLINQVAAEADDDDDDDVLKFLQKTAEEHHAFLPKAEVFAFAVTLTYFIHMVFSLVRWKSS
ncbi:hypothetical protein JD844_025511 [Phrynosoma platyrhinos]|uniref:Myelin and lymphocyte protein n=1 Tax=Phrynosoma platyrhinos TaxID=52577 RepID=A0ABQ7SZD0_PHRPL|nr:hypothetical protein JD844_025511 [Phrynosoma platyrhinos]